MTSWSAAAGFAARINKKVEGIDVMLWLNSNIVAADVRRLLTCIGRDS
jgi:hypothetical protein